ncbi:MAG: hypothetical protein U0X76_12030 [Bacteroidia bacterium]
MKLIRISFFLLLLHPAFSGAQKLSADSLQILFKCIQRGENDSVRKHANDIFYSSLYDTLKKEGSFSADFSAWKNLSVASDADKTIRLYTWTMPYFDGSRYDYFGFVQIKTEKPDSLLLIPLSDSTLTIKKPESEKLRSDKWLGAIYYSVSSFRKSGVRYYTLLGWKGWNQSVTKKVIEIMTFEKGILKFGFPVIKTGSVFRNRVVFSFTSQATMTLRFDKNGKQIVFDHINNFSKDNSIIGGPDGSYDLLKLKGGKWLMERDIDARSEEAPSDDPPKINEKK